MPAPLLDLGQWPQCFGSQPRLAERRDLGRHLPPSLFERNDLDVRSLRPDDFDLLLSGARFHRQRAAIPRLVRRRQIVPVLASLEILAVRCRRSGRRDRCPRCTAASRGVSVRSHRCRGRKNSSRGSDPSLSAGDAAWSTKPACASRVAVLHRFQPFDVALKHFFREFAAAGGLGQRLLEVLLRVRLLNIGMPAPHGAHPVIERLAGKLRPDRQVDSQSEGVAVGVIRNVGIGLVLRIDGNRAVDKRSPPAHIDGAEHIASGRGEHGIDRIAHDARNSSREMRPARFRTRGA